jgi:hypothetical protein
MSQGGNDSSLVIKCEGIMIDKINFNCIKINCDCFFARCNLLIISKSKEPILNNLSSR